MPRLRPEPFGAIVALEDPPLLAHVDRAFARRLGAPEAAAWEGPEPPWDPRVAPPLSAPTEVHLLLNARCPARCRHCYVEAGPQADPGPDADRARALLAALARLGVFHVALGGGESALREDLLPLAAEARRLGMVPNLTMSGLAFDPADAPRYRVFGQVNVSLDGLGPRHRQVREDTSARLAERALTALLSAGVRAGINHVLTAPAWDELDALVERAATLGACEVEILRLKPAGRARGEVYRALRLSDAQHRALFPRVLELARRHRIHLKLDCSFGPMIFAHDPEPEVVARFGILGCDGGNSLGSITPDGRVGGCSFSAHSDPVEPADLARGWAALPGRQRFRRWRERAPEPCRSCPWSGLCQGGCHVVAEAEAGSFDLPDPECPRVLAFKARAAQ